jgi:hypothetical protein
VEAFPWDTAPRYLLRDRDCIYGQEFTGRVELMGIKEVNTAPRSPADFFDLTSRIVTIAARTSRWKKTHQNRDRWIQPTTGKSSRSPW